jgi:general secretion pathway protein K
MSDRRGFALIAALWLLVAISVLSLALETTARSHRLAAANLAESVQARTAADAGIEQTRARLVRRLNATTVGDPWAGADSLFRDTIAVDPGRVLVSARDVGAQLNLNRATEDELRRFFVALPIDAGLADRLAQSILDWRDEDDLHRPRGAERDEYLKAGAVQLPRNGPFQSLDELAAILGMTRATYERVRPNLTLLGSGQVNVNAADRPVLLALPGMTEEAVAVLFRYRRRHQALANLTDLERDLSPGARNALAAHLPELLGQATTETREVAVTSVGWVEGSPVRVRITALFVRARGSVFQVWSRIE